MLAADHPPGTHCQRPENRLLRIGRNALDVSILERQCKSTFGVVSVTCFSSGWEALKSCELASYSHAIFHVETDDIDGLDYISALNSVKTSCKVVIASNRYDERLVNSINRLNYSAWIDLLDINVKELRAALGQVGRGLKFLSPSLRREIAALDRPLSSSVLSDREQLVLSVIGAGLDNVEASVLLGVEPDTVRSHRANIMSKLSVHHKGKLVSFALSRGYVRFIGNRCVRPGFEFEINR